MMQVPVSLIWLISLICPIWLIWLISPIGLIWLISPIAATLARLGIL